jgi:germination protein M
MKKGVGLLFFILLVVLTVILFPKKEGEKPSLFLTTKEKEVNLFFLDDKEEWLVPEIRSIERKQSLEEEARETVKLLLLGPESSALHSAIPSGTTLRELYIYKDVAYIDLSRHISENHPGGSWAELCTIFSIVNTILLNIPELLGVKILVGGRERETLAGHIDITKPFRFNDDMVKGRELIW